MNTLRIIFMGTPEFAVPSLEILIQNKFNVVAVVTAPDRPQGRGQKLTPSLVKQSALKHGIPVLQPTNLKAPEFLQALGAFNADLQVVVAFRMLPEAVWSMPKYGTFNLHASLLPQYRGAAPINWAIMNGEKETGVTTFFLQHEIDTGHIIFQEKERISEDDDAGSLYDRLMVKGSGLVLKTAQAIASGTCPSHPQQEMEVIKHAPKIFRETCEISWNQPAEGIRNFVRGLSPYPAAWSTLDDRTYKIFRVEPTPGKSPDSTSSGDNLWRTDNKSYLYLRSTTGWVSVLELQPEGKKRMTIAEFFRGNKLE
ncbi:MAG: methionyl-tRNA formyltransferase [Cytophagales bacterium]|nr:methionyl-tRNA formyltransferase [Cytophagales bacterium]